MLSRGLAIHAPTTLDLIARQAPDIGMPPGRICIVTGEIAGPDYNGGIGTANRGLALALQAAGFSVDVLYTRVESGKPFCYRGTFEEQVAAFRTLGVNLLCIDHKGRWDDWLGKSLRVMEALQSKPYDIAFFDDTHGNAYYTALAKRTGSPALANTKLVVVAHSATQWICELNHAPVTTLADIRVLEIERRSIELADYLISPSAYILRKYEAYGWALPPNTLVRQNIMPFSAERSVPPRRTMPVDEIVFFGRMERRKGIWLFCEALDRLKYELGGRKVTFLGKFTTEDGESTGFTLLRRSAEWPFAPTLLYNYDRDQALAYLKGGNRLAVMPSREDNSPCVILECLIEGIPFIASSGSGGQELIAEADHANCLFEPTADSLTAMLRKVLADGAVTGQPSCPPQATAAETVAWVSERIAEVSAERSSTRTNTRSVAAAAAAATRNLLLLAPEELSPEQIHSGAREAALRHADFEVTVFAENMLRERVSGAAPLPDNLRICAVSTFAKETARMQRPGGMLVLCRLDQPVPADVLLRAETSLLTTSIDALTVMRGHARERVRQDLPHVCTGTVELVPEEFKTGNSRALMALTEDSNSGLIALRSELAGVLGKAGPIDPQICRLKDIRLYVHEILLTLSAEGRSFELLPDCFLPAAAMTSSREVFALPGLGMQHLLETRNMPVGSDAALLSRLSIEILATDANRRNAKDLLSNLSSRVGEDLLETGNFWPPSRAFATYAKIAHATGRPGLALSLMANSLTGETPSTVSVTASPSAIAMRKAQTVELASLVADGRHTSMNLDHPWSLRVNAQQQEIEIHPNNSHQGDATLVLPGLSFASPVEFTVELELTASAKGPVCFEIELQKPGVEMFQQSWILQPGERRVVGFGLPPTFHGGCDVLLATSMMRRRESTEGAHAKWHKPAFRPR